MDKKITVTKNGPYAVNGGIQLEMADGTKRDIPNPEMYKLCRCGHSRNKPFCDGSHITSGFDDSK